ncbi:hypothetical protein J3D47_002722 [Pseudomonas laurylsulfativorans]|uniref:hypothetical protein n=1 Tax=Pseudomonas laurylsulfativorans TaxID=1943631 RepID=UPI0020A0E547|nr:hypothetical protein [Pseudomonas laurylsulfativorans]MCP1418479.1 hypothetical protein [Pseudomonas laurylsulfativorans]
MISQRTRCSLAQFLAQQDTAVSITLFSKYNIEHPPLYSAQLLMSLINAFRDQNDRNLLLILQEIIATQGSLRASVSPKHVFDERMYDLIQCLLIDGYIVQDKKLTQADPSIADAAPLEDDLIIALRNSGFPQCEAIIEKISDSAEAFRSSPSDYNAALTNARVALEALAVDVAADVALQLQTATTYNPTKWGEVIGFLRSSGEITVEEEKGLAGVFGFLSPGAHRPIGIPENQMARLGRSFALNMCWFLLQNRTARRNI